MKAEHQTVSRVLNDHPNVRAETRTRAMRAIDQLGYRRNLVARALVAKHSLSIVGFDDIPESEFFSPPLTTIRQDFGAVGRRSIDVLLRQIEFGEPFEHERLVVPPRFVLRGSTAVAEGGTSPSA